MRNADCGLRNGPAGQMRIADCGLRNRKTGNVISSPNSSLITHHSSLLYTLGTGVRFVVHLHQVVEVDVRVFLGGRETRVPQQFLNSTEIRPCVKEVRGKGVAEGVRAGFERNATVSGVPGDEARYAPSSQPPTPAVEEDWGGRERGRARDGATPLGND